MTPYRLCVALTLNSFLCRAAIIQNISELKELNPDFIVVGGGTAGSVLANRLSENPDHSILVLEAGGTNADVLDLIVPFLGFGAGPNTQEDWNYTTTPQENLNGRSLAFQRGFVLGGSSSVNGMIYTRGSKEDFDRFAQVTQEQGWSWNSLVPYMRKNERFSASADHHNTTSQFNPAVHGFDGINTVSLAGFPTPIDSRVIQTTSELSEFSFNLDMNSGYPLGLGWVQSTIKNGSRSSAATSYLAPPFVHRPNLNILLHAQVTRIIPNGGNTFRTVEFFHNVEGPFILTAQKEIILSAGSIGSPSILMHSGIGHSSALSAVGIEPLHHLPSVGKNMSDHVVLGLSWVVHSDDTWETFFRNATLFEEELQQWNSTRTGLFVDNHVSHICWLRIPDSSIPSGFLDAAAGPNSPHFELLVSNGLLGPTPASGNFMSISLSMVAPLSRGYVSLNSSDSLAPPLINPGLLDMDQDLLVLREAVRSAFRFVAAPAWQDYIISPVTLSSNITDEELDAYIRSNAAVGDHSVGTASMSAKGASYSVVDPDLRVKGLAGVRVVDISVAPFVPSSHTQAATYIIAERAADLIKETWN